MIQRLAPISNSATSNVQGNIGSWYDQMTQLFGLGVPYINDPSNRAADRLIQNLLEKGIGIDGSVKPTATDFFK